MLRFRYILVVLVVIFGAKSHAEQGSKPKLSHAVFAGGCFWCMEPPFDKLDGVSATISGYTGGNVKNPDYRAVSGGQTGHYEVIEIQYDPNKVTFSALLDVFWANIDPLDGVGQFCDKGPQYLSAIFVLNEVQRKAAEQSLQQLKESGMLSADVQTAILDGQTFYPAEDYHQDYYVKNPIRYKFYRTSCGRDRRLSELWGDKAGKSLGLFTGGDSVSRGK